RSFAAWPLFHPIIRRRTGSRSSGSNWRTGNMGAKSRRRKTRATCSGSPAMCGAGGTTGPIAMTVWGRCLNNWSRTTELTEPNMNLTDELRKLADLRAEGRLTEQEFAEAKRKLLAADSGAAVEATPGTGDGRSVFSAPRVAEKTYWSSRWSSGNLFFRDSVTLAGDGILFRKGRMFGSQEERINYRSVAPVRVTNGVF